MRENELYRALDASVASCQPSDYWKNRMVRQIVKGEELKKKTKLSVGAILVAALLLVSAVALAVSVLVNEYYARVAQMDREGALERWQLEDKVAFVTAMRECNFAVSEDLYRQAADESLPAEEREAAADRIINDTYGDLIRRNRMYFEPEETDSLGLAPDLLEVFDERYYAEHPDWEKTREGVTEYYDALGYYLRDEIGSMEYTDTVAGQPAVDEAYAVKALRDEMKDTLGWDPEAVDAMEPEVVWDEVCRIWIVSGEVSAESMEKVTDHRRWISPTLRGNNVEKTDTGYRYTVLVDERGRIWTESQSVWDFARAYQEKPDAVEKISLKRAMELAETAVKEAFHPDEAEWKALFEQVEDAGTGEADGQLNRIIYHRHYAAYTGDDMLYGAVVNMATGKTEAVVSYRAEDRTPVWQLLEYAAKAEQSEGWYVAWKPESRQGLAERIRACGLLPENAYWQNPQPTLEETDALAAEAFGAQGHLSLVNVKVMEHALLGTEENWDQGTKALADRLVYAYEVHSSDLLAQQQPDGAEITPEEAARIMKAAVCKAWEMPADALDGWEVTVRKAQETVLDDITELNPWKVVSVYYRVFLVRPDGETGQDTFGGQYSMNYRMALDGTILDSENHEGWYSPEEDREKWRK